MLFTLKKVIGSLLMPFPALLLLMALGILLLWFSRWQKSGKILITTAWLLLLLVGLQPVADRLLSPLEKQFPTWQNQHAVDYIVVLGGGYTWNPEWAPSSNMINNSLPRLTEGVRIWRANPDAKMIFTGAAFSGNSLSTAEVGSRVAQSLGVPKTAIITLDKPHDTEEEAQEVAKVVGDAPFALVTSASHLPRAVVFFQQQGLHPWPAPANQMAMDSPLSLREQLIPSAYWLGHSERAIYEWIGQLWQRIKQASATDKSTVNP